MKFDQNLKSYLKEKPKRMLNSLAVDNPIPASTLTLLIRKSDGMDYILFNKRTDMVEHHKGQICFPGGRQDDDDEDLIFTAKRETHEEMGIRPGAIQVLGQLGEIFTPTGYKITPFVGRLSKPHIYKPNPFEIDEIFEVSLDYLLSSEAYHTEPREYDRKVYQMPVFTYEDYKIWGATAKILKDLLDAIREIKS